MFWVSDFKLEEIEFRPFGRERRMGLRLPNMKLIYLYLSAPTMVIHDE